MTFTAPRQYQTLKPRVYAAFGSTSASDPGTWVWTDITRYAKPAPGSTSPAVPFSAGAQPNASQADPSQISLTLDNSDGRFTALNPSSPYWPNVVRDTPLKLALTWDGAAAEYEILTAFVTGWPLQPLAGPSVMRTPITAAGRLRRLRRSAKLAQSALRGTILGESHAPVAYWSMEDAAGSTQFAAATAGVAPMVVGSDVAPSFASPAAGSAALPDFSGGGTVKGVGTGLASQTDDFVLFVGDDPGAGTGLVKLLDIALPNADRIRLSLDLSGAQWNVQYTNASGGGFSGTPAWSSVGTPFDGKPHLIRLNTITSHLTLSVDGVVVSTIPYTGSGGSGTTSTITVGGTATTFPLVIGHVAAWAGTGTIPDHTQAMLGYPGESATDRVTRVCAEAGIPVTVVTGTVPAQPMGVQGIDTVDSLLEACADIDNGLLHDAGPSGSLVYASGAARYNAPVAMTLDFVRHQIGDALASTYDDQDLVTQWTISREGGSSATYAQPGATDILAQPATVNAAADSQLANIASWRTHVGSYDAYRLPSISIDVLRNPELAQAVTSLLLPERISPVNLPSPYPPGSMDQFVEGYSGVIDSVAWQMDFNCRPYAPWQVAVVDTDSVGSDDTALTSSLTAAATAVTVTPGIAGEWTTDPTQFPLDLNLGGERVTATDCNSGTSVISQDGTFEIADTSAWSKTSCTFVRDSTHMHSGHWSALLTVTGTPSQAFARMPLVSVTVGETYTFACWVYAESTVSNVQCTVDWFTSGSVFISTSNVTVTLAANTWTKLTFQAVAPATAAFAGFGPTLGGNPATGAHVWCDDFAFTHQIGAPGSTQTFTVVRSVNGVSMAHAAGDGVDLWIPAIVAL